MNLKSSFKLIKLKISLLRIKPRKIVIMILNPKKNSQKILLRRKDQRKVDKSNKISSNLSKQKIQDQQIITTKALMMNQEQRRQRNWRRIGILQIIPYRSQKLHRNLNLMTILNKSPQIKMRNLKNKNTTQPKREENRKSS